jgi:hypothetical protein
MGEKGRGWWSDGGGLGEGIRWDEIGLGRNCTYGPHVFDAEADPVLHGFVFC